MIPLEVALRLHDKVVKETGGSPGIRDLGALESALARPFGGFGGEDFYSTPEEKAASILESVLLNHPFVDGNKRTGFLLTAFLLSFYDLDIDDVPENAQYDFVISVASGNLPFEEIVAWLRKAVAKR